VAALRLRMGHEPERGAQASEASYT